MTHVEELPLAGGIARRFSALLPRQRGPVAVVAPAYASELHITPQIWQAITRAVLEAEGSLAGGLVLALPSGAYLHRVLRNVAHRPAFDYAPHADATIAALELAAALDATPAFEWRSGGGTADPRTYRMSADLVTVLGSPPELESVQAWDSRGRARSWRLH